MVLQLAGTNVSFQISLWYHEGLVSEKVNGELLSIFRKNIPVYKLITLIKVSYI